MFFFQNLTAELFLLESPDDSYFPKSGGSTFLKTVGSHFSEICGNKITAYKEFVLNMDEKMQNPEFLGDTTVLLRPGLTFDPQAAWEKVRDDLIVLLTK